MIGLSLVNLDGAVNVANPPAGFTAATGNGSTDDAAAINAIFAALPINGSYVVWFPRPSNHYRIGSTLWIRVSGTTVIWANNHETDVGESETDSERTAPKNCWLRPASADLAPYVRIADGAGGTIKHVRWYGGSIDGANTVDDSKSAFELVNAKHCEVVGYYTKQILPGSIMLATSGMQTKFCSFRHMYDEDKAAANFKHNISIGYDPDTGTNSAGSCDCCWTYNHNGLTARIGYMLGKCEDCAAFCGNIESGDLNPYYTRNGCVRWCNLGAWYENYPAQHTGDSGASSTQIGFGNESTNTPGAVGYGWTSSSLDTAP